MSDSATTEPPARRDRSKQIVLLVVAVASVVALAAATQSWVVVQLMPGEAAVDSLGVTGQKLNPSLSPVAIAAFASALVLTIAGPVFRRVLGVLIAVLGVGVAIVGVLATSDPRAAASSAVATATGLAGDAQYTVVASVESTAWPYVVVAAGAILILAGLGVLLVAGRWKSGGRKYESSSETPARDRRATGAADVSGDRISEWDALSAGDDPTEAPGAGTPRP